MTAQVLLDTDTLSLLMRNQSAVVERATQYLAQHKRLTFSLITRYEILRGLMAKNANTQLARFQQFCAQQQILPLTDPVIQQAAMLYSDLYRRGQLISDADILIAATAQVHKLTLVTNNVAHFERISALDVVNWHGQDN